MSFSAADGWRSVWTKSNTDNDDYFTDGDKIGISSYYLKQGETIDNVLPNFMYDQVAEYSSASKTWLYSPIKYWPLDGTLDFYAYAPYGTAHTALSPNTVTGYPTLTYSNPSADIDLMAAEAPGMDCGEHGTVTLNFHHLLAKVNFAFTYKGDDDYRPVVHVLKYNVPYSDATYDYGKEIWRDFGNTCEIVRYTQAQGVGIYDVKQLVPDFTAYLLPGVFPYKDQDGQVGSFTLSLNNIEYSFTPSEKINVKAGKTYTINFEIQERSDDNYFITSYSMWEQGEKGWDASLK